MVHGKVKYQQTSLTAFGDGADDDAFFTGKPKVDDALGYAFLFRNYRPDNGKWLTADPMGYPDGWNNLAYCNNWVNNCVDYRGCACQIVTYSEVCFGFSHRWVEVQKDGVLIASAGFYPSGGVSTWGDIGAVHFDTQETHIFDAEKTQRCLYEVSETDAKTVISRTENRENAQVS